MADGDAFDVQILDYHQEGTAMRKMMAPIHPGEILLKESLRPLAISADTALRLSRYFNLSERFWLNLQARFDLETDKDRLNGRILAEVKVLEPSHA